MEMRRCGPAGVKTGLQLLSYMLVLLAAPVLASPQLDVRVSAPLTPDFTRVEYEIRISDCALVQSLTLAYGAEIIDVSPTDFTSVVGGGCFTRVIATGAGADRLAATVAFVDGTSLRHEETFHFETERPALSVGGVSVASAGGGQQLIIELSASDDVDISHVDVQATGLRASDLRAAGGVVAKARGKAFAASEGSVRLLPGAGQQPFVLSLPFRSALDAAAIMSDGVVLIDAVAVDASGNQRAVSALRFTGSDVSEEVLGLSASPAALVFSDLLQTAVIVPTVNFQFRGPTPLPGAGSGASYTSSHPELVGVTSGGVVYPLAATDGNDVSITVAYPGTAPVTIPVDVDPTRRLSRLEVDGLDASGNFEIPRLNAAVAFPPVFARFDDGSRVAVGEQFALEFVSGAGTAGVLDVGDDGRITARAPVDESAPLDVTVRLVAQPSVSALVPVVARDAIPNVTLAVPGTVEAGETMTVKAAAEDDLNVSQVRLMLDGSVLASLDRAPYEVTLAATEQMVDRQLRWQAVAVDNAGQQGVSALATTTVVAKRERPVPELDWETPVELQRVVEGAPVRLQLARKLDMEDPGPRISHVDFFVDGGPAGTANFPRIEQREEPDPETGKKRVVFYELWYFDVVAPAISVNETSVGIHAVVHGESGGERQAPGRLIRVAGNQPPSIKMTAPGDGQPVTAGQVLPVRVEFSDDTLALGTSIELSLDDALIETFRYQDENGRFADAITALQSAHAFSIPVTAERLGDTLRLRARVIDHHGEVGQTPVIRVQVREDQPPTVALSQPVAGAHFIAGLPIALQANANDDVRVERVDFNVNGRLVGSDANAPFTHDYETVAEISAEQTLTMFATAFDDEGQSTQSAPVTVTLGFDEEPPVVNIASPSVSGTEGGTDLAAVIEDSEVVFKVAGYDNVGVETLTVRGIRQSGSAFVLTGDSADVLSGEQFAPQQIPGALRAYSALKLIKVPLFSRAAGVEHDRYPVEVIAKDRKGNTSIARMDIAVGADTDPVITDARADRSIYFPRDVMRIDVVARDDRAVDRLEASYYLDGAATPFATLTKDASNGLQAAPNLQAAFELDLVTYNLSNTAHEIRVDLRARDNRGNHSDDNAPVYSLVAPMQADTHAPLVGIQKPVQGSVLYRGRTVNVEWRAVDDSALARVWFTANGVNLHERAVTAREADGSFSFVVPASGEEFVIEARGEDAFGNVAHGNWRYALTDDEPPVVTISSPPPGTRLLEGEHVTLAAFVQDDDRVQSVEFFVERDGVRDIRQTIGASAVATAISAGKPLSYALHVPQRPESGVLRIGVRATDNGGLGTDAFAEIDILDDAEAPAVQMTEPAAALSLMPGDGFGVKGSANDNIALQDIAPVLVSASGEELPLTWETFKRTDRVETIKAPNPDGFGSVIVAQRAYTDFEGRLRLPGSFSERAGEVLQFGVRASDYGINRADSNRIQLTVLADEEAPVITVAHPGDTVIDRQPLTAEIEIADNVGISAWRVYLGENADTPLAAEAGLDSGTIALNDIEIDLEPFAPIPPEGVPFTLVVEAEDAAGNIAIERKTVRILPDRAPRLIAAAFADAPAVSGGLLLHQLTVEDDFANSTMPLRFFPVYTSLKGEGALAARDPSGMSGENAAMPVPHVRVAYTEANDTPFTLNIGGEPHLLAQDGQLAIHPLPAINGDLLLDFGPDRSVRYDIRLYRDSACSALVEERTVDGPAIDLNSLVLNDLAAAVLTPRVTDASGQAVDVPVRELRIDLESLREIDDYLSGGVKRTVQERLPLVVLMDDLSSGVRQDAFVAAGALRESPATQATRRYALRLPTVYDVRKVRVLGHATDRYSVSRGAQLLDDLAQRDIVADQAAPGVAITAPVNGMTVVPLQRFDIKISAEDDSGIALLQLLENRDRAVRELAGAYGVNDYVIPYQVPRELAGGNLELLLNVSDPAGTTTAKSLTLPVASNEKPLLKFTKFSSYKVNGQYRKVLDAPERLNYGEFWVRTGETFRLDTRLEDDAGISRFTLNRIDRSGNRIEEFRRDYASSCPQPAITARDEGTEITFTQTEPAEYEAVLDDTYGNRTVRTFLVHPLTNMSPEVRITAPANDQYIVAGTFRIKVGVAATDDRTLSADAIEIYANGVRLARASGDVLRNDADIGGAGAIEQAYAAMYDSIEHAYSIELADEHGRRSSPNATRLGFVMNVPAGLVRFNEPLKLEALIRDSDGAVGRHAIDMIVAADEIRPETAVLYPGPGFGAVEASNFDVGFRAFDNVKVEQLTLFSAYGVRTDDGRYLTTAYAAPLRSIDSIEARDFEPVTTVNIDTPVFVQSVPVTRLSNIVAMFPDAGLSGSENFDLWLRVIARDAAGNERVREMSFPVRVDERPVVDIVAPLPGARHVEETPLTVNVNAFDDVGIASLRLTAVHAASGAEIYNILKRNPPYAFQVTLPAFDATNPVANRVTLRAEAIDNYGAAFGDPDRHHAEEQLTLEIIEDKPPAVLIGKPVDGSEVTEGEFLLVQVNGTDDVGIERASLQVSGLVGGNRVFADATFPYEFLLEIPYGQAGRDLSLHATVVEQRFGGEPRSASTPSPVVVHVDKDVLAPDVTVLKPLATGTTVVEKRALPFTVEASDNVRVSTVQVSLFVDKDSDGAFTIAERVHQLQLLAAPYAGSISVASIEDYLGAAGENVDQLSMLFEVRARDGAGNETRVERPVTLVRNTPPEIRQLQILDARGYSLGSALTEVTEGRGIIVHVLANDAEAGVDGARLFMRLGDDAEFTQFGEDASAPFQFHFTIPAGRAGETLAFEADAVDVDGYRSVRGGLLELGIAEDKPPQAAIVKPDSDQSAIIDGQDIEVWVEAIDDLGAAGIDRVVFHINGTPTETVYESVSEQGGSAAQEHVYRALISPPAGVDGFVVHAVAYDVVGHATQTAPVRIGRVEDTVAPRVSQLWPPQGGILTGSETVHAVVAVDDIGDAAERQVHMRWLREYQDASGQWQALAETEFPLVRNDARAPGDDTPVSDPNAHRYVYLANVVDGNVLTRGGARNERVRIVTTVTTPNHAVSSETLHEIGLPVAERRFLLPAAPINAEPDAVEKTVAQSVYYGAIDQFRGVDRTGSLVGAWSSIDPLRVERGLGNALINEGAIENVPPPRTGLFLLDDTGEIQSTGGEYYLYSELLNGASEMFTGLITEIHSDANFILAGKSGVPPGTQTSSEADTAFITALGQEITRNPETGGVYLDNAGGELLIFAVENGDGQFGLPYLLRGRIDLPYADVYGVTRKDDLALVANGHGGVLLYDISNLAAPYRVGYVKPNGFARDVAVKGKFAFIAASHEGLVIADLGDPATPIVAKLDTFGVANRIEIVGDTLYLTDMAGEGGSSALNIIDISDPHQPQLKRVVELEPARPDFVADGAYDVAIAGDRAYVSVHYSDQEDAPAQSAVEIIELGRLNDVTRDATVPAVIHRDATAEDFGVRGLVLARGAMQAAAGKRGVNRLELPALTVIAHTPAVDQSFVSTALDGIEIELSAVLPAGAPLANHVRVQQGNALIGADVTNQFTLAFGERGGEPARRFIRLTRNTDAELEADTAYYVTVLEGLAPLAGLPLASDYVFGFRTSPAGSANGPDIVSVTPDTGSIEGGTPIVVRGHDFGVQPQLFIGGRELVVDHVEAPTALDPYERIHAITTPNYAGPAAVEVITESGLNDLVIGGFTYVDILSISFIEPPVVRVSQAGEGDRVRVVGYGFHDGVELLAWRSGDPDSVIVTEVDQDRLHLESAEEMSWAVPDFGDAFRGFVDVEIRDDNGRRFLMPNALFYGQLVVDRRLETEPPLSAGEIEQLLDPDGRVVYVPDPLKLPPGMLVDTAADSTLGLVYALGRGVTDIEPDDVKSLETFHNYFAPGWISLVHYQRDALSDAAPMHGLGYFNLPQELTPTAMHLAATQLYVAAEGEHFPFVETPYEDQRVILVYDRETRLPGASPGVGEQPPAKDRDVLYSLPLPFTQAPVALAGVDYLLFAASPADGVAIISVADAKKPSVIRVIKQGSANGMPVDLAAREVQVSGSHLHVIGRQGRFVFDLAKPTLPQVRFHANSGVSALSDNAGTFVTSGSTELALFDAGREYPIRELGRYDGRGFRVPGIATGASMMAASAAVTKVGGCNAGGGGKRTDSYFSLFDTGRAENMTLLDALKVASCVESDGLRQPEYSDDGVVIADLDVYRDGEEFYSELVMMDTHLLDLASTYPRNNARGVPTDAQLRLRFTRALGVDAGELETFLGTYFALLYEDGTPDGVTLAYDAEYADATGREVIVTPVSGLAPDAGYRVRFESVLGSRRTAGLFDHTVRFATASNAAPAPEIIDVAPSIVLTGGGETVVRVANGDAPGFLIAGEAAAIVAETEIGDGLREYRLDVPPNNAGPASLEIINANGARALLAGALQYVEPLALTGSSPRYGSVNGGTKVTLTGVGFKPGTARLAVSFSGVPVADDDIKVLDGSTVEVITPAGRIGTADITVTLDNGQSATLAAAFEFQQPVQSNIRVDGRIYDAVLDPTGTYMIAAAGKAGVAIYNIDPSQFTTNPEDPTDLAQLRRMVDRNGDGKDDRIVTQVGLPPGYVALGIDTFFERSSDRVFVTAVKPGIAASLFIIAFDSTDITKSTLVSQLPLPANFARGIEVENNQAVIAMGDAGIGLVDSYLHTKTYLASRFALPGAQPALDVTRLVARAGVAARYAAVAGDYDIASNRLQNSDDTSTGGFHLLEFAADAGWRTLGSLAIPASRVVVEDHHAYLAAGDGGLVIVDISDLANPRLVSRIASLGHVYDVAVNGNVAYAALGANGIATVDITNPARPVVTEGMEAFGGSTLEVVVAGAYAAYVAGIDNTGSAVVQVTPDVVLKIHRVDPASRILDRDAFGDVVAILRFNKTIDLAPDNLHRFAVEMASGERQPLDVEIINNDALLTLTNPDVLAVGQVVHIVARAGVASVKPLTNGGQRVLYTLGQDQRYVMTYRGDRPDALRVDAVMPRRIPEGRPAEITIAALGVPRDIERVRAYAGGVALNITAIESNDDDERVGIITASVSATLASGMHDIVIEAEKSGVWESASLRGGLMVDAPIRFDALAPQWGPLAGGTVVTITGSGFEPGNTVMDGLQVRIGSVPVASVRVLAEDTMQVTTRGGRSGRNAMATKRS